MSLSHEFGPEQKSKSNIGFTDSRLKKPHHDEPEINVVIAQTSAHRVTTFQRLPIKAAGGGLLAISNILRNEPDHGMTEAQTRVDAYVACVHLATFDGCEVWRDEKRESIRRLAAGTVHINDMRHDWRADIRSPFHVVNFHIPQSLLDDFSDEEELRQIEELDCPISNALVDPVLTNLTLALLPALASPHQINKLFADYAARAVIAHLARSYGSSSIKPQFGRGGLAPWQERRAKDMLCADLSGEITLSELAGACRLSCSHFSQAFKQTVGCPPHQWLLDQRVERAKCIMLNTKMPLSEIALITGFADQSHFTRVFSQRIKVSPAAWRRTHIRQ